jgi:hypothetical protein
VVRTPAVSMLSLSPTRTPASGPSAACPSGVDIGVTTAFSTASTSAASIPRTPVTRAPPVA